jgi:hypothetical protein
LAGKNNPVSEPRNLVAIHNREWEPSQKQPSCVCLQPHQATVLASAISVFNGVKPVPLCEPSQNGCDFDRPHAHQK